MVARAEGRRPLGYLRAFAYAGCDPKRMGLGPVFATSKLLSKAGIELKPVTIQELKDRQLLQAEVPEAVETELQSRLDRMKTELERAKALKK